MEVGDFTGAALRRAVEHGLTRVVFAGMAGKLTKLAAGVLMTHYTRSKVSLKLLQDITLAAGGRQDLAERVATANTARHAAELWDEAGLLPAAGRELCARAARVLQPLLRRTSRRRTQDHTRDRGHHGRLHRPDQDRRGGGMSPEVTVIGCDGRPFGPEASQALAAATLVIGAPRHLETAPIPPGAERIEIKHLDEALDALSVRSGPAAVLASGDPGFFGIVRALRARGIEPRVIPATSSVTLAFARLGLDWDDALVISAHGREPRSPKHALAAALAHPKAAILTAPRTASARDLGAELLAAGKTGVRRRVPRHRAGAGHRPGRRAGEGLRRAEHPHRPRPGSPDQQPQTAAPDQAAPSTPRWLAGHQGAPDGWALPEDAFEHRDSMITKAEVRALVLARLGPAPAASSGTWARARARWRWNAPGSAPT